MSDDERLARLARQLDEIEAKQLDTERALSDFARNDQTLSALSRDYASLRHRADAVLSKPFLPDDLVATARRLATVADQ